MTNKQLKLDVPGLLPEKEQKTFHEYGKYSPKKNYFSINISKQGRYNG